MGAARRKALVRSRGGLGLDQRVIGLAGNPNVGKSTVFNAFTGMNQHTGNWPGKTVANARGRHRHNGRDYIFVDLPGTYSLSPHSAEEEVARDFLLSGQADAVVVVCDAACLERNLGLALQILEITSSVVLCVNLMDEAKKKGITIDLVALEKQLGIPVAGTNARGGQGLSDLIQKVECVCRGETEPHPYKVVYPDLAEVAIQNVTTVLEKQGQTAINPRWLALALLTEGEDWTEELSGLGGLFLEDVGPVRSCVDASLKSLENNGISREDLRDMVASGVIRAAEKIMADCGGQSQGQGCGGEHSCGGGCGGCGGRCGKGHGSGGQGQCGGGDGEDGRGQRSGCGGRCGGCGGHGCGAAESGRDGNAVDRKLDRIFLGKRLGIPIMLLLLCAVFWLTIVGANYPSRLLGNVLFWGQDRLTDLFAWCHAPDWLHGALVLGVYRVTAWVVSVMLPPMAIFFPLFTILEDFGYLPRIAFNLDHSFQKAKTCGKQALTMTMGFGCNAVGVMGCRIIDSPRERLIAIITNSFVPCNGRFPTLIAMIGILFMGMAGGMVNSLLSAILLTAVILLGVFLTLWVSRLLSETVLQGEPSSFTLELPPYRTPQLGKLIVRSLFDRTLFVLGRAVSVAAPAGLVIWLFANISLGDGTLLHHGTRFLDPFARLLGLDGVIFLAFILGFPANEIVVPIMIMTYLSAESMMDPGNLFQMHAVFQHNGWTWTTAVSVLLLCLVHWPCSTTCLTIRKETGSLKWTALSIAIPTVAGLTLCFLFNTVVRLLTICN